MDEKVAAPDGQAAEIAARQHGAITTAQLLRAGLSKDMIAVRVRRGALHRVFQGVFAVGHPGLSQEGRWMAAVLACLGHGGRDPGESFLSHRSAAALWGMLPDSGGAIDVAIIGEAGRARHRGIRVHRPRTLEDSMTTHLLSIPTTDPARTLADLKRAGPARGGASRGEQRKALRQASYLGLALGSTRRDPTRSELERQFLDLCQRRRLPMPKVNMKLAGITVDFLWPEHHLVVETDGYRAHRGRAAFEDDKRRDLRLRALGYDVVRLSEEQIRNEGKIVAATLRRRLLAAN